MKTSPEAPCVLKAPGMSPSPFLQGHQPIPRPTPEASPHGQQLGTQSWARRMPPLWLATGILFPCHAHLGWTVGGTGPLGAQAPTLSDGRACAHVFFQWFGKYLLSIHYRQGTGSHQRRGERSEAWGEPEPQHEVAGSQHSSRHGGEYGIIEGTTVR